MNTLLVVVILMGFLIMLAVVAALWTYSDMKKPAAKSPTKSDGEKRD